MNHLEHYKPTEQNVITKAAPGDRIQDEGGLVWEVLFARADHTVCRSLAAKTKTVQPLHFNNGTLGSNTLYRRNDFVMTATQEPGKTAVKRVKEGPTKLERCREIFLANPSLDKAAVVKMFIEDVGCTAGGANTYFCLLKKG